MDRWMNRHQLERTNGRMHESNETMDDWKLALRSVCWNIMETGCLTHPIVGSVVHFNRVMPLSCWLSATVCFANGAQAWFSESFITIGAPTSWWSCGEMYSASMVMSHCFMGRHWMITLLLLSVDWGNCCLSVQAE